MEDVALIGFFPFQSTHPARDATACATVATVCGAISIHASREGCDANIPVRRPRPFIFQSTHPARDATVL